MALDSSLLVGLLHCELGVSVEAFTFEYSEYDGKYNEYERARQLTRQHDIPHHKIKYGGEWLRSNFEDAIRQYEEPFTYGHHTARLAPVRDEAVSLLLNGILPESEFLSRTATYALRVESSGFQRIAAKCRRLFDSWPLKKLSRVKYVADIVGASPSEVFYNLPDNTVLPDALRRRLSTDAARLEEGRARVLELFDTEVDRVDLSSKPEIISHLRNIYFVPDHLLWWNYRWAHASGIEMAAPHTAPDVASWMESFRQSLWPPHQESIRKDLIRRTATTVMPDEFAYNQKIAQSALFWIWLQGSLCPLLHKYLSPAAPRADGLFDVEFVQRELQKHIAGKGRQPYLVWTLLCFMIWKRVFLESEEFT